MKAPSKPKAKRGGKGGGRRAKPTPPVRRERTGGKSKREKALEKELALARRELARVKAKRKKRKKAPPVESETRKTRTQIGRATHIRAREVEGEPQYVWRELEERAAPALRRRKKGPKRWARLVVEMSPTSLLRPDQYRKFRGAPVIRTRWMAPEQLVGRAAEIADNLQKSGAVTPSMKVVIVESPKKPPRRVF